MIRDNILLKALFALINMLSSIFISHADFGSKPYKPYFRQSICNRLPAE